MAINVEIRQLAPEHGPALGAFLRAVASDPGGRHFRPHGLSEDAAVAVAHAGTRDAYFVLLVDSDVLAYGMLRGWEEGYDTPSVGLAVHPDHRGRGLGRMMMQFLHLAAEKRGARSLRLKVDRDNGAAIRLYSALGYVLAPAGSELVGVRPIDTPISRGSLRILIPSDNRWFIDNLTEGYGQLGHDVTCGVANFWIDAAPYDVVHLQWPEELTGWSEPSAAVIRDVADRIESWRQKATVIASVHNLFPHGAATSAAYRELFAETYRRADVIHHYSHVSKEALISRFPELASARHLVTPGFNYERLLPLRADREVARRELGLSNGDVAFMTLGAVRSWEEGALLRRAYGEARVAGKRLILASRADKAAPARPWVRAARAWQMRSWSARKDVISTGGRRVPEDELCRLLAAADAVLVIRSDSLNSAVPGLAMTMGRMVVAPDIGSIGELLAGTGNVLFDPASPASLSAAMEAAASMDTRKIGARNAEIAATWSWRTILSQCLDAARQRPPAFEPLAA